MHAKMGKGKSIRAGEGLPDKSSSGGGRFWKAYEAEWRHEGGSSGVVKKKGIVGCRRLPCSDGQGETRGVGISGRRRLATRK